ncbi:MAG: isochorismatase family protein [Oceanospirillaceae bacterium]|nr:isochorismatase family protein [Oceanospirillaceae bacterium]MCP5334634.1 isochorismatase family protein [Oceanospirillaceae bacterium]MCP5351348.1 isochorismatase family protein [Oceanospirillaceae bacterium]
MKTAFLIIDVQNGVFGESSALFEKNNVLENIRRISQQQRALPTLFAYVQHEAPGIVEFQSPQWQLHNTLDVQAADIYIRKQSPDAFFNTQLHQQLQERGIEHLLLCGYSSDFCIDRTAFSAASQGYKVTIVADAHTTHDKPHLSAGQIRTHHNFILSKHPSIQVRSTDDLCSD